jgi:hypothetical protein
MAPLSGTVTDYIGSQRKCDDRVSMEPIDAREE